MSFRDLVEKNRSCRRFHENESIRSETLRELVDLARLSASAANMQPLRYILSNEHSRNGRIFPHLAWAGYLNDWDGPEQGERPAGYIIILGDTGVTRNFGSDQGIAAQSILLGAVEKGLAGCILSAIRREDLRESLRIPPRYEILLVVALGRPAETRILRSIKKGDDIKYWRDDNGVHYVPKLSLSDIILEE